MFYRLSISTEVGLMSRVPPWTSRSFTSTHCTAPRHPTRLRSVLSRMLTINPTVLSLSNLKREGAALTKAFHSPCDCSSRICKVDHGLSFARTPHDSPPPMAVTIHHLSHLVKQDFTQAARPMLQVKVTATGTAFIETGKALYRA